MSNQVAVSFSQSFSTCQTLKIPSPVFRSQASFSDAHNASFCSSSLFHIVFISLSCPDNDYSPRGSDPASKSSFNPTDRRCRSLRRANPTSLPRGIMPASDRPPSRLREPAVQVNCPLILPDRSWSMIQRSQPGPPPRLFAVAKVSTSDFFQSPSRR